LYTVDVAHAASVAIVVAEPVANTSSVVGLRICAPIAIAVLGVPASVTIAFDLRASVRSVPVSAHTPSRETPVAFSGSSELSIAWPKSHSAASRSDRMPTQLPRSDSSLKSTCPRLTRIAALSSSRMIGCVFGTKPSTVTP
jgi:hypothetical protein